VCVFATLLCAPSGPALSKLFSSSQLTHVPRAGAGDADPPLDLANAALGFLTALVEGHAGAPAGAAAAAALAPHLPALTASLLDAGGAAAGGCGGGLGVRLLARGAADVLMALAEIADPGGWQ
jgi:hypothetical protein